MWIIKNFDQLTKNEFDQMPKLLENFDQLKMSSEIWSSDRFPIFLSDGIAKKLLNPQSRTWLMQLCGNWPIKEQKQRWQV